MESWFLYFRNSIAAAIRRLNAEFIVTDALRGVHKQSDTVPRMQVVGEPAIQGCKRPQGNLVRHLEPFT